MHGFKNWLLETNGWKLYHGSNSNQINGPLRVNERDAGWFGTGFYLTAYPEYASKWGQHIFEMLAPQGKYAEVVISNGYSKINFLGDAENANQEAGGSEGWIENEELWAKKFTATLQQMGYVGVRVHQDQYKEVLVFDPARIQVVGKVS